MPNQQLALGIEIPAPSKFPRTRYQGSKLKLVDWIWENIRDIAFDSALDAFGGTGCVSHMLKARGKTVTYNEPLRFNYLIGLALIENERALLSEEDTEFVLYTHPGVIYPTFVQDTFHQIYYLDEENAWIDRVVTNIGLMEDPYKKALAFFALFQACIIKRPFNLFHRKNLYIRTTEVRRSFGNKSTWDRPFEFWFRHFAAEANQGVFSNGRRNRAVCYDPLDVPGMYDLVYVDTPYMSAEGVGVDYLEFYHFLEGLADYENWPSRIDYTKKHLPVKHSRPVWCDRTLIYQAFDSIFRRYSQSVLVVSYRDNGIPSEQELCNLLSKYKKSVIDVRKSQYQYVLSPRRGAELLLIAR